MVTNAFCLDLCCISMDKQNFGSPQDDVFWHTRMTDICGTKIWCKVMQTWWIDIFHSLHPEVVDFIALNYESREVEK